MILNLNKIEIILSEDQDQRSRVKIILNPPPPIKKTEKFISNLDTFPITLTFDLDLILKVKGRKISCIVHMSLRRVVKKFSVLRKHEKLSGSITA